MRRSTSNQAYYDYIEKCWILILKSNERKIPRIFFDYIPKSSTFDKIFVRKKNIFVSLQRHSEIIKQFFSVQIQCAWNTTAWYCARIQMQTLESNVIITLLFGFSKPIMWPSISWLSSTVGIRTWIHFQRKH